jgi:uncharacterized protein YaeQ
MALTATLYTFEVALSHVDRGVYDTLTIKAACHPSESEEYLLTRVLAYCLEFADGIAFSKGGISDPDEPALTIKDLTGAWRAWIEIGAPDAARLHFASKASPRVVLYTHKDPRTLFRGYEGAKIHKAEQVEVYAMDRELLVALSTHLGRRNKWTLSVMDGTLYVEVDGESYSGVVERLRLPS